jgi:hypothetical protein
VRIATPFTFEASDATLAWLFWGGPAALGSRRIIRNLPFSRAGKPAPFAEVAEGQAMT